MSSLLAEPSMAYPNLKTRCSIDHCTENLVPPVTNAINILQACIYKSVKTGQFLKTIISPYVVKFNLLMLVFTLNYQVL